MLVYRFALLFTTVFLFTDAFGQWNTEVFDLYKKDAELTIGFNNRRTHLYNEFGTIYGFKIGLNFDRRLKNTFVLSSTIFDLGKPENEGESYKSTQLHFASIAEEFTFYAKRNLSFSTYFTVGYGVSVMRAFGAGNIPVFTEKRRVIPFEFGLQTSYVVFTWLDLRAGAGWRLFALGNDDGLSGYFFKVGAGVKYKAFRKAFNF
ncbi:MAG: hypothetical protein JXQ87_14710 [Bacteroidia bacterium]